MKKEKLIKILFILLILFVILIGIYFVFFRNNTSKKLKIGNNSNSQDVVNYFLNSESYIAEIEVTVKNNKLTNKYKLKQEYISGKIDYQEVLEPENIAGVKIIKDNNNLRIENANLNLNKIWEKYDCILENDLDLCCFLENYKNSENSKYEEKDNNIIMRTTLNGKNKVLYIDKSKVVPLRMKIKDTSRNIDICILYNNVTMNNN